MSKYYIYCSNNQAYYALINNSIMAKSVMRADFRSDTASYLSNDYLFISTARLQDAVRCSGISDTYYPVALEVSFMDDSSIPVRYIIKDADEKIDITEERKIGEIPQNVDILGAFICGEIPIAFLSGIIFDNETQKRGFFKSSLDMWFPEELYKVWNDEVISENITLESLKEAAEKINTVLTEDELIQVRTAVIKRSRVKAAYYYAVDATRDWNIGEIRTNIDGVLVRALDSNDMLRNSVKEAFDIIAASATVSFEDYLNEKDIVLDETSTDVNRKLFDTVIQVLLNDTEIRSKVSKETFDKIRTQCLDIAGEGEERTGIAEALKNVQNYLVSTMDPDEALGKLGKYDVLRAFMIFMDQQDDVGFLKRATTKLSQTERRYAYIMYGILNGMSEVERDLKSNRALELRLEDILLEKYQNEHLINIVIREPLFIQGEKQSEGAVFGLLPSINIWYDCKSSQEILLQSEDKNVLEKIYDIMAKTSKDDPILEQDIYKFKEPVSVRIQVGEEIIKTFIINCKKDAKEYGKAIEMVVKQMKEEFNVNGFKKYLAEEKRYQKFYRKNTDFVQECCRKVKS